MLQVVSCWGQWSHVRVTSNQSGYGESSGTGNPGHRSWARLKVRKVDPQHFTEFSLCLSHRTGFGGRRHLRIQTNCYAAHQTGMMTVKASKLTRCNLVREVHCLDQRRTMARLLANSTSKILYVWDRRDGRDIFWSLLGRSNARETFWGSRTCLASHGLPQTGF